MVHIHNNPRSMFSKLGKPVALLGLSLAMLSGCALTPQAQAQLRTDLGVTVNSIRGNKGKLCLKIFSSAQGFPNGDVGAVKRQCTKITGNSMSFNFPNLKSGSYAVAVYHDANGNNKFDRDTAGIPLEGYGFSQNPNVTNKAPSFGDSVLLLAGSGLQTQIRMRYP